MRFVRVNNPPIRRVKHREFGKHLTRFKQQFEDAISDGSTNGWDQRILATSAVIGMTEQAYLGRSRRKEYIVYSFGGIPVGLMILTDNRDEDALEILELVTSPWTGGVGTMLIEYAANYSPNGQLFLLPSGSQSAGFYKKMGFETKNGVELGPMNLQVAQSEKWTNHGGKWVIGGIVENRIFDVQRTFRERFRRIEFSFRTEAGE